MLPADMKHFVQPYWPGIKHFTALLFGEFLLQYQLQPCCLINFTKLRVGLPVTVVGNEQAVDSSIANSMPSPF